MKRLGPFILLAALFFAPPAQAGLIFLDDYENLTLYDVITDVFRDPTVGPANSAIWIEPHGSPLAQVNAVLDGKGVEVTVPQNSTLDYLATLGATYSYGRFVVQWDMIVSQVNGGSGMFFVRFPKPPDLSDMQILFGFLDDGRLVAFYEDPHNYPASYTVVGHFTAGTRYNIRLPFDLTAGRYSIILNGQTLLFDQPIPSYLSVHSINKFGFDLNQTMPLPPNLEPKGNSYLVDNVRFSRLDQNLYLPLLMK
jgi:hypothetical protein